MSVEELIRACGESMDSAAWEEFISRFRRPIGLSILRVARQWRREFHSEVDDLIQETYLKLFEDRCRLLVTFAADHPEAVLSYIKTIAANVAHDHFKSLHSQKRGSGQPQSSLSDIDPPVSSRTLGSSAMIERQVLLDEIDRCLGSDPVLEGQQRDRLIFWLYYGQGLTAKGIAALPVIGLTAKGVESAIVRLTRLVRNRLVEIRGKQSDEGKRGEKEFEQENRKEGRSFF